MRGETIDPTAEFRRSLAALELATLRHRGAVRRRLNVSEEELCTLLHLVHHGGTPQRRLAELTTLSRSGAGAMLQRLEHDGLVQRRTDPDDRRLRFVELAPSGRERLDAAYAELDAATGPLLAQLADADLTALAELLAAVAEATMEALGDDERESRAAADEPDPIWERWS